MNVNIFLIDLQMRNHAIKKTDFIREIDRAGIIRRLSTSVLFVHSRTILKFN